MIVPASEHFPVWKYEKAAKRKDERAPIVARASGEVNFHEGYVMRKAARRLEQCQVIGTGHTPARPEITSIPQTYLDLRRPAAVRAAFPCIARAVSKSIAALQLVAAVSSAG